MKRIVIITPFFYPHIGGSQQYMEELYAALLKTTPELQVDVLCYNTDNVQREEEYKGMHIYRLSCWNILPGQFSLPNPFALFRFFSKYGKQYDLFHCSTRFFDSSWWAVIYAKLTGKKIVLTDHCAATPVHANPVIYAITWLVDRLTGKIFLPFYDKVFVVSHATEHFLKKTFGIYSTVIYAGVDTSLFKPIDKSEGKRVKVLYLGRMIESKGVLDLFAAAQNIPEADFVFAGPGILNDVLRKKIQTSGSKHIQIVGKLERNAAAEELATADIFVNPSHHSEGIPLTLFQAGACRLAVITTDRGGVSEVIENKRTGLVIPPGREVLQQAIEKLLSDQTERKFLAENLYKEIIAKFTWENSSVTLSKELQL
jgi:L-malate glycosyltransferase